MSEAMKLAASVRLEAVKDMKESLPAVVYGSGMETTSLVVKRSDFERVFAKSGESGLIALALGADELPVLIKDLQMDPVKNRIIHVDFYKVNMNKKVVAEATLNFIGEAPAVKTFGATIIEHFDTLEIECLPSDLIQKIDIDLSTLVNIGDAIHISDIKLPDGVVFTHDPSDMIVNAIEPNKIVVEEPVVAAADAAVPEAGAADAKPGEEKKPEEKSDKK